MATGSLPEEVEWLYRAMAAPLGIVVKPSNTPLALARLYRARALCSDPDLAVLQFRRSPFLPDTELWITKGSPKPTLVSET